MDWSAEEVAEEVQSPLRRRSAFPVPRPPPNTPASRVEGSSSPPLPWVSAGSRSPSPSRSRSPGSPRRYGRAAFYSGSRSPSPRRSTIVASSVRTIRRAPSLLAAAADPDSGGEDTGVEDILASLREGSARSRLIPPQDGGAGNSASVGGGAIRDEEEEGVALGSLSFPKPQGLPIFDVAVEQSELEAPPGVDGTEDEKVVVDAGVEASPSFSFPPLPAPPCVDAADVIDAFAISEELRKANALAEFLDATMGANTGPRSEAIKKELLVDGRVLDIRGLERWLRRTEAVYELAWFTDLCADESNPAPPLDLFESAFRALERASSAELHCGADARRRWIGSVAVPEFFFCPFSKKLMEDPVVISSGKTVDRSALEKWWKDNQRICPVTKEVLVHSVFIPDILITLCISHWRELNCIGDVAAVTNQPAISPEEEAFFEEVTLMPHSPIVSEEAYDALRRLHKLVHDQEESAIVHLLSQNPGAIAKLASVLPETCLEPDPELDGIILGIMEKAASYAPNKVTFGDDQYTIPVLIARAWLGPVTTRAKCAQILGLLADDYYNKIKIGELGGLSALIELLSVGDIDVKKTVARVIVNLCEAQENLSRFVREGVADAAISLLRNDGLEVEAQAILMQAEGFELATTQILEKLETLGSDEMCQKMSHLLWCTFVINPGKRRADVPSVSASAKASSSSSNGGVEGSSDHDEVKKDVKTIVSWLQKRCYYPWTYRYRD